ncbi:hypothetical protein ILYODFUR_025416 [Ilyodon furcidens]|uniref:Uncharacterized protein n=1 Tax=Ilyodon furcidens TaxID=33524 RepID=A0ABV0T1R0_9TELE
MGKQKALEFRQLRKATPPPRENRWIRRRLEVPNSLHLCRKHINPKMARSGRPLLSLIRTGLLLAIVLLPGETSINNNEKV